MAENSWGWDGFVITAIYSRNVLLSRKQLMKIRNKKNRAGEIELFSIVGIGIVVIFLLLLLPAIKKTRDAMFWAEFEKVEVEITDSGWQITLTPAQADSLGKLIEEKSGAEKLTDSIQRKIEKRLLKTKVERIFLVTKYFIDKKFKKFKDDLKEASKKNPNDAVVLMSDEKNDDIKIYSVNKNILSWKSEDINVKDTPIGLTILLSPDQCKILLDAARQNKSEIYLNSILHSGFNLPSQEKIITRQLVCSELVKFLELNGIKFESALRQASNTDQFEGSDRIFKNLIDKQFDVLITVFFFEEPKRITLDVLSSIKRKHN